MSDNFRMLYYDTLGLKNVDQKKTLEQLLNENALNQDKLRSFSQQFILPEIYRTFVWKVLLDILPLCKESTDFVREQRKGHFEDLKQALTTMHMFSKQDEHSISECRFSLHYPKNIVLMYLLDVGMLSLLNGNILKRDGHKVFVLESISQIVCGIITDECDSFWISKCLFDRREKFIYLFGKLPKYIKYYLQLEDKRLFEHLCEIQLFKVLPYDRWFQTYYASVFVDCVEYLKKILDKLVAGSCNILVFVCVALLLTFSLKLKQLRSSEVALKLISHLPEDIGLAVIEKTMELWDQHRNSLCVETESYLICYHEEQPDISILQNGIKKISCLHACFTFDEVCYCRSNFMWTFQDDLDLTDKKCNELACETNTVVNLQDSFSSNHYCVDPAKSSIFNLTGWFKNKRFENFVNIKSLNTLDSHIKDGFEEVELHIAYSEHQGDAFYFDFGNGLKTMTTKPFTSHWFTQSGDNKVQISVSSQTFPCFAVNISKEIKLPITKAELIDCVPHYYLMKDNRTVECHGQITGGNSAVLLTWHSIENYTYNQEIIPSSTFTVLTGPCLSDCPQSSLRSLANTWQAGVYLMPLQKHFSFGYVYGIEFYAKKQGPVSLVVCKYNNDTDGYQILQMWSIMFEAGYNKIPLSQFPIDPTFSIGFIMTETDILETIAMPGNEIEFYTMNGYSLAKPPISIFRDVAFRAKVLTVSIEKFKFFISDVPKFSSYHAVYFTAKSNNTTVTSNNVNLAVIYGLPILHLDFQKPEAAMGAPYELCVRIENAALVYLTLSTYNNSVNYVFPNGTQTVFTQLKHVITARTKAYLFFTCETVVFKKAGTFLFNADVSLQSHSTGEQSFWITALPKLPGLKISTDLNSLNNTVYQITPILFDVTVDYSYPYPLTFSWDFGNSLKTNLTESNVQQSHFYQDAGEYTVTISASYLSITITEEIHVNILKTFELTGQSVVRISDALVINMTSNIAESPDWTYKWFFGESEPFNTTINQAVKEGYYSSNGGVYHVRVELHATVQDENAVVTETFNTTVYEQISGAMINIKPGHKALKNHQFILVGSVTSGNLLNNTWISDDFEIVTSNSSEVIVSTSTVGNQDVTLTVKNLFYEQSVTTAFPVTLAMRFFEVNTASSYVEVGFKVLFSFITRGADGRSYEIHTGTGTIQTNNDNITMVFDTPGIKRITFDVILFGSLEMCNQMSAVSCSRTIKVTAQIAIKDLQFIYITSFGGTIKTDLDVYTLTNQKLVIEIKVANGTDVEFSLYLQGIEIKLDSALADADHKKITAPLASVLWVNASTYELEVIVSNKISKIAQFFYVHVNDPITDVFITAQSFIELLTPLPLEVGLRSGTDVTFRWSFADQELSTTNTSAKIVTHYLGVNTIFLTASNPSSIVSVNKSVEVILPIQNPFLICNSKFVKPNSEIVIQYGFDNGSYVSVTLNIDNSPPEVLVSQWNGSMAGNYTTKLTKGNYILKVIFENIYRVVITKECEIVVEERINSVYFKLLPSDLIYIGDEITFDVTAIGGTNIAGELFIETRDNIIVDTFKLVLQKCPFFEGQCMESSITYRFDVGNHYHIRGIIKNNVNSITITSQTIFVIGMLHGAEADDYLEIVAESATLGTPTNIHFIKRDEFSFVSCSIDYGDGSNETLNAILDLLRHTYVSANVYTITLNCISTSGILQLQDTAFVQLPMVLSGLNNPETCVLFGDSFNVTIRVTDQEMLSHFKHSLLIKGKVKKPHLVVDIDARTVTFIVRQTVYEISGDVLEMVVILSNYVSEVRQTYTMCIMKAIAKISAQTPAVWRFGSTTPFKVQISVESAVDLKFFYGDNSTMEIYSDIAGSYYHVDHLYATTETFDYHIQATNNVSTFWFNSSVQVTQSINNVTLQHQRLIEWPSSTINFTLEFAIILSAEVELDYQIFYGDGESSEMLPIQPSQVLNNHFRVTEHEYAAPGCYAPALTLRTQINSIVLSSQIYITNFNHLQVQLDDGHARFYTTSPGQEYLFHDNYPILITISNTNNTCYLYTAVVQDVVSGEEIHTLTSKKNIFLLDVLLKKIGLYQITMTASIADASRSFTSFQIRLMKGIPSLHLLPGPEGLVNQDKEFLLATIDEPTSIKTLLWKFGDSKNLTMKPQFEEVDSHTSSLYGKYNYFIRVQHSYQDTDSYKVSVSSSNQVSSAIETLNVLVSEVYCERPELTILTSDGGKIDFYYDKTITILSDTRTDCGRNNAVKFQWSLYQTSQWELNRKATSSGKLPISLAVDTTQSSLNIPRRTLKAGHYIVKLTVEMRDNGLDKSQEVYLTILERAMQAIIAGGSLQMLPWQQDVVLDASNSQDPNEASVTLEYDWYCEVEKTPGSSSILEDCFQNGRDTVQSFGPVWRIKKNILLEGAEYTFTVKVRNKAKERQATTTQKVILVDKAIPVVFIECVSNCGDFVNPSNRFSLTGTCTNCDNSSTLSYRWSADETSKPLDLKKDALTSETSNNIVIKSNKLEGDSTYSFWLEVTKKNGLSALANYEIKTSRPPHSGSCDVSPKSGITLQTIYTVTCKDWVSSLGSLNYQVSVKRLQLYDSSSYQLLKYGPQESLSFVLTSGDQDSVILDIRVVVIDLFEASSFLDLNVQVNKTVVTDDVDLQSQLANLTTGDDNVVKRLQGEGDTQGLVQLIGTIANTLNDVQVQRNNTDLTEGETQSKMDQRKEMRREMTRALSEIDINNLDTVKQTADVIGPLLKNPEEVSEETQELALQSMENVAKYLKDDPEVAQNNNPEQMKKLTTGVIEATGNLLQAAVVNLEANRNLTLGNDMKEQEAMAQKSSNLTKSALKILDNVVPLLFSGKLPGEEPTRISSETIALELSRQDSDKLQNNIETIDGGRFQLPKQLFDFGNNSVVVDSKMSSLKKNPFSSHESANHIKASISSLEFSDSDNKLLDVVDLSKENQVEFFVHQILPANNVVLNSSSFESRRMIIERFSIKQQDVSIVTRINIPKNTSVRFYLSRGRRPTATSYDVSELITGKDGIDTDYVVFPVWRNTSFYYVGVSLVGENYVSADGKYFQMDLEMFVTGCLYLDEVKGVWTDQGCRVGPLTNTTSTHCLCNHLTWLASSFFVPPRKLDLESELLKLRNLDEYPALLATFCVLICLSLVCMIWARRKDLNDTNNNEPTFLRSQSTSSGTTYHVAMYTGHRGGSGTTATPTMIISGQKFDTRPLALKNDERKLFGRGTVETFLFTTGLELGDLKYITIWHDDRGDDPAWFLSRMTITNLNQNKQYHCFCNDWLAVDQSDGKISRVLPIALEKEMQAFENIFLAKTTRDLTDGHIWFSIITRPTRSNFSRVQRVVCCLCLLLSTMLTNAMFYRVDETIPMGDEIEVSGFTIRWTNILIGIQSAIIVLPINIIVVLLFRRAAPHKEKREKISDEILGDAELALLPSSEHERRKSFFQTIEQTESGGMGINFDGHYDGGPPSYSMSRSLPTLLHKHKDLQLGSSKSFDSMVRVPQNITTLDEVQLSCKSISEDEEENFLPPLPKISVSNLEGVTHWPHWVIYVAWFLSVSIMLVAGFFTLLYGLSFGKEEQEKWLFSFFISVFTDIMFNQPLKIIIVAALITLIFRKLKDDYIVMEIENFRNVDWGDTTEEREIGEEAQRPAPPSDSYIEMTRKKRLYEAKMVDIVIEIVAYTFYLFLCLLITYGHRDPDAYAMTKNIENIFVTNKFDQVNSVSKFWGWSLHHLSPGLSNDYWYNGIVMENKGCLSDGTAYILGRARMRQVRVRKEKCLVDGFYASNATMCGRHFEEDYEDTTSKYCTNWTPCDGVSPLFPEYWMYRPDEDSGSFTTKGRVGSYPGGGYIVDVAKSKLELDSTLRYLERNNWLDDFSRAVMVDFTVYNPQSNFYVMVMLLLEIPANGGGFNFKRILSTRLDRYSSGFAVFLAACELLFLGLTLYYMVREYKKWKILRMKYFIHWQNWVEIASFSFIWTSFALLIVRFGIVSHAKTTYLAKPNNFINFETAAMSDQAYGYTLACLVFILFIKFLKLLRFNRKMSLMFKTVSHASTDTLYFSISFFIMTFAFAQMAHLMFLSRILEYSNFVYTLESLLNLLLGSFDYGALIEAKPVLGKVFFFTYFVFSSFILLNMFISIINESFSIVQKELRDKKNKYELIDFLRQRFGAFLPHFMTRKKRKSESEARKETVDNPNIEMKVVSFKETSEVETFVEMKEFERCKKRVEQCEAILCALHDAVDRITVRVDEMVIEDAVEQRMWEYIAELMEIKFSSQQQHQQPEIVGRGKQRAIKEK